MLQCCQLLLDIFLGTILLTDPTSQRHQWLLVIVLLDEQVTKGEERIHILLLLLLTGKILLR